VLRVSLGVWMYKITFVLLQPITATLPSKPVLFKLCSAEPRISVGTFPLGEIVDYNVGSFNWVFNLF